jgi:hypothetical protein
MSRKSIMIQARILFTLILVNFLAQVPYYFHLYYRSQSFSVSARSFLIMGAVFAFFLTASWLLFRSCSAGYPLMLVFLSVEFLFYLGNVAGSAAHGYGLFFQIRNPDPLLRVVYSIGYLNLFAAGYFLLLLLRYRVQFVMDNAPTGTRIKGA